eukprot:scaffold1483_cov379-Prasinococcus_capsulatus_cf.AAC.2
MAYGLVFFGHEHRVLYESKEAFDVAGPNVSRETAEDAFLLAPKLYGRKLLEWHGSYRLTCFVRSSAAL